MSCQVDVPDIVTHTALVSCLGVTATLWKVVCQMLRVASRQVRCNVILLGAVLSACGGGRWEESRAILGRWMSRGLKPDVACFNAGIPTERAARASWNKVLEFLHAPSDEFSYNAAASVLGLERRWEKALVSW
eukprot:s2662_g6.t1